MDIFAIGRTKEDARSVSAGLLLRHASVSVFRRDADWWIWRLSVSGGVATMRSNDKPNGSSYPLTFDTNTPCLEEKYEELRI